MNRLIRAALCVALPATLLAGCSDWLTGPGLTTDPNRPERASRELLLVGVTATQATLQSGGLARSVTGWVQQFAGTDRQALWVDEYDIVEDDFTTEYSVVYQGGGLLDMRDIQQRAEAAGDLPWKGIAQVWEALTIGTAASTWGDIPYSQAVTPEIERPERDPQEQVYAQIQSLLDEAIANLGEAGANPGNIDLIYGGNVAAWVEAAYTLKARYYMHWAQAYAEGNPAATIACGGDCRTLARDATLNGISSPARDFRLWAAGAPGQENIWYQFMFRERDTYMRAGEHLVELLRARNDDRLEEWFAPFGAAGVIGSPPAGTTSASVLSAARGSPGFRQPIITFGENLLLRAEAEALLGNPGPAQAALTQYRAAAGITGALQGATVLEQIYEELYLALFQNIEAWNVYKRSCYPNVELPDFAVQDYMPRRVYYGADERNANPNIPAPGQYDLWTTFDHPGGLLVPAAQCHGMGPGFGT